MVVCRNWNGTPGSCRYGDRCRFEHPQSNRGVSSSNPFAPLQRDNLNTGSNNGYQAGVSTGRTLPYQLDKNQIITDLSSERPQWILSAYGPGRNAPEQLFGGSMREQSFEEMRLLHYIGMRSGNPQQATQEAEKLVQASEQQIQTALNNIDGAINYIINAEKNHPNRIDIVRDSNSGVPQNTNAFTQGNNSNPFQATKPTSNTFSAPIQPPTTSVFGAPSMGAKSGAFGQPPALGAKPNPFGAPSQPAFGTPAFGAPSQPGASGGAFGRPSALGQKPNPFGASSSTSGGFSSFANTGSAFGQPSQPATSSAFGAPSQPVTSSPFGAPSQPALGNPFGQPSGQIPNPFSVSSQPTSANPFGGTSSQPFSATVKNPFAATSNQPAPPNSFGGTSAPKLNPFGPAPAAANPFQANQPNQPELDNVPNSAFGAPSNGPKLAAGAKPFGVASASYQPVASNGDGQHPPLNSYATVGPNGRLTMFKGKKVVYRDSEPGFNGIDNTWEKIWFPQGAPPFYKDTEMEDAAYDEQTKAAYMHMRQTGQFEGDVMPMLPPKREWCLWDF